MKSLFFAAATVLALTAVAPQPAEARRAAPAMKCFVRGVQYDCADPAIKHQPVWNTACHAHPGRPVYAGENSFDCRKPKERW